MKSSTGARLLQKRAAIAAAKAHDAEGRELFTPEQIAWMKRFFRGEINAVLRQIGKLERAAQRLGGCG